MGRPQRGAAVRQLSKKTPQDAEVKKQNKALREKFKVKGVPVAVLIAPEGKVVGRIHDYTEKEKWQKQLQQLMQKAQAKPPTKETKRPSKS